MSLTLVTRSVDDLMLDPANARAHSKRNVQQIAESLAEFGQRKPIVITAENLVLAGNGTLQAARFLGWEDIQAIVIPAGWSDLEQRAFAIADNRTAELAKWNTPLLAAQLEALAGQGFMPAALGFELPDSPEVQQNQTHEVDMDAFEFNCQCPECGFEFDAK